MIAGTTLYLLILITDAGISQTVTTPQWVFATKELCEEAGAAWDRPSGWFSTKREHVCLPLRQPAPPAPPPPPIDPQHSHSGDK